MMLYSCCWGGLCVVVVVELTQHFCCNNIGLPQNFFFCKFISCPDRTMSIIHSSLESSTAPARHPIRESLNEITKIL